MVEKDFQRALTRGLKAQGCFAWPWPDLAKAVTKPFDICMSDDGTFEPIECKLTKYTRKKPLGPDDIALSPANFKGRGHQVPRLLQLYNRDQAYPLLAVCVVRIEDGRVVEKRACLRPITDFREKITWTIAELFQYHYELQWRPTIGWVERGREIRKEFLKEGEPTHE